MSKKRGKSADLEIEMLTLREWQQYFRNGERILYRKACDRRLTKGRDWQDYILYLGILPKLVLTDRLDLDFEPTNDAEATVWSMILLNYTVKAQWMDFLVPGNKPQIEELNSDFASPLKAVADLSKAVLNLCVELYTRVPELQEFDCPSEIWFVWECEKCFELIVSSGLISEPYRPKPSKDRCLSEASALSKWLLDISPLSKDEEVFPEGIKPGHIKSIRNLLITRSAQIAQTAWTQKDNGFRIAYRNFAKAIRSQPVCSRTSGVWKL